MRLLAPLCLAGLLASCGSASFEISFGGSTGSIDEVAADLVEDDIAVQLGIELTAACPEVDDPGVGSTFVCTGTTADGQVVHLDGVVDEADSIDISTTNVILADQLGGWEDAAGASASEQLGSTISVDCGDDLLIFATAAEPFTLGCTATDQAGESAAMVITITDIENGTFDWQIG